MMVIVTLCLTLSLLGSINTFSPGQEIVVSFQWTITAQKMKFSIKNFSSNCDQIRRRLRIWSHLLKKSLMEKFSFLCSERPFSEIWKDQWFSNFLQKPHVWGKIWFWIFGPRISWPIRMQDSLNSIILRMSWFTKLFLYLIRNSYK